MMIDKRLVSTVKESKKYIIANVLLQWAALLANIVMMTAIAVLLQKIYYHSADSTAYLVTAGITLGMILIRYFCSTASSHMSYLSSKTVKRTLREMVYRKLLHLGSSYKEKVQTSEIVQLASEGIDQLETYFGAFLPQFFYAMVAPLTLFVVLSFINLPSAVVLLICVPLIPVSIAAVQTWAKKLLGKYWGQYTTLGDTFLENLQGLTTLKIYQADDFKHQQMNEQAENFRKITMRVLTMQLNSITIMDLIAYGGAALGVIMAATQFRASHVGLSGCILIILLAADFFLPMRLLGSFFHIAMNGMAASEKIFKLLDLDEPKQRTECVPEDCTIHCQDLCFSYDADRQILNHLDMTFPKGSFTAIVGESGCGKSTIASILMGRNRNYSGTITVGGTPLADISEEQLLKSFTYVSHQSYLFKGTVRENLQMGCPSGTDEQFWTVLEKVNLAAFLKNEQGLDTPLAEKASNLSGGQCQRLALARALLHDSPVYIFDETTSNIDVESENDMMAQIYLLAKTKSVILISHRLANVVGADNIYVLSQGTIAESGTHEQLLDHNRVYAELWKTQQELEHYTKGCAL